MACFGQNAALLSKLYQPTSQIQNWTTKNGLPQNSVNSIIQSHNGFLWIGTFGGLCRFDGLHFERIAQPELAYERVIALFEAKDKSLWVGTENNGIFRLQGTKIEHYSTKNGLPGNGISSIFQLNNGVIGALIHDRGLVLFEEGEVKYEERGFFENSILLEQAIVDKKGFIWLATSKGVFRLKEFNGKLELVENSMGESHGRALSMNGEELFFADKRGVFKINQDNLTIKKQLGFGQSLSSKQLLADGKNNFYCGLRQKGVLHYSKSDTVLWTEKNGLPKGDVTAIFKDKSNNLWIGLNGGGLAKVKKNEVATLNENDEFFNDKTILAVHKDYQNNLWIGTYKDGIFKLSYENGNWIKIPSDEKGIGEGVWSIASDTLGNVWYGTFGYGIFHINQHERDPVFKWIKDWGATNHVVLAMYFDKAENRLLVGNNRGGIFEFKNQQWSNLIPENVKQSRITQFVPSLDGSTIYFATQGQGIGILKDKGVEFITADNGLAYNHLRCLYLDGENNLWAGTYGKGISVRLNGESKFKTVNVRNGLFDNLISTINEDDYGYLWFSCNRGVFKSKRKELIEFIKGERIKVDCKVFDQSHGMGDSETNGGFQSSSVKIKDYLLYPTAKGISVFNSKSSNRSQQINDVVIENIVFSDSQINFPQDSINLPIGVRDLEVVFTAPYFNSPELIQFEYKLEGYDSDWISNGFSRKTKYTRLAPGSYSMQVRARSNEGVVSNAVAKLLVIIPAHWYEIRWIQLLFLVVFFIVGIWIIHRTQNRALQKTINEQKIIIAEQKIGGLSKEVTQRRKELTSYTLELIEKNNLLREIKTDLNKAKNEQDFTNIEREIKLGLNQKNDWKEFKERFEQVDNEFLVKLRTKFPELTKGQVRLASLIKLGFSSKQIAEFLNNTPASVDVARSKLRKKMRIPRDEDFQHYLDSL
ncbi:MAG: hypothetical protein HND54_07850 [Bacteroidetes bacterium]|nr:hypothetical protein [Bacteroidota bacterium]